MPEQIDPRFPPNLKPPQRTIQIGVNATPEIYAAGKVVKEVLNLSASDIYAFGVLKLTERIKASREKE